MVCITKRKKQKERETLVCIRKRGPKAVYYETRDDEGALCVLLKRKKQKARPRGVNLKVRWGAKVAMRYCS